MSRDMSLESTIGRESMLGAPDNFEENILVTRAVTKSGSSFRRSELGRLKPDGEGRRNGASGTTLVLRDNQCALVTVWGQAGHDNHSSFFLRGRLSSHHEQVERLCTDVAACICRSQD